MRVALEIKPGADPNMVMAFLYRHTALQQSFSFNMTCLVPGADGNPRPERIGLKAMLRHFLDFRFATVKRRFEFDLQQLRKRIHILEGFKIVFDGLDKAIKLIRESNGKPEAAQKLMAAFKLDEEQTTAILDTQLYKIAQLEIKKILEELREKKKEAARIEEILASKAKMWSIIKGELRELEEKYASGPDGKRRTRMATDEDVLEFDEEAYIVRENTNVVLTRDGWIKRVGRLASVDSTRVREGDEVIAVVPGSTLEHVAFFSDDGVAYTMRLNEVPASSGYGEPLAKYFKLGDKVRIVAALPADERFVPPAEKPKNGEPSGPYVLVATADGQVLRVPFAPFRLESTKAGRRYVRLNEGDRVVMVALPREQTTMMLASIDGRLIHFAIEDVNILAGVGKGVMGIKLDAKDTCLGGALLGAKRDRLVVETSSGKTLELLQQSYQVTSRAGKGHEIVKRSSLVRVIPPPIALPDWDTIEAGAKPENGRSGQSLF